MMESISSPQTVIALGSLIVAICAIAISICEGRQTRHHHRLSLKPSLVLHTNKGNNPTIIEAKLVNAGLGPAVIKHTTILISGRVLEGSIEQMIELVVNTCTEGLKVKQQVCGSMTPGFILRAAEEHLVLRVQLNDQETCGPKKLGESFDILDIVVEFESFYGESYIYDSRDDA